MFDKTQLTNIRNAVKAECARRTGYDSIASFANETYNAGDTTAGAVIMAEQGRLIIDPLVTICDMGDLALVKKDRPIPKSFNETTITNYVNALKNESITGPTSSCRSACTGLCVATCHTTCNGCTGCNTGCKSGCNESCGSGCKSSCGSSCANSTMVYSR